ncbi:MAG: helix-turn-helix domain-containing protein [Anaerotignaceae bacterium]
MKFYTVAEVASILKVAECTVSDWVRKGKLGAIKIGGTKTVRISDEDLKQFCEENRVVNT